MKSPRLCVLAKVFPNRFGGRKKKGGPKAAFFFSMRNDRYLTFGSSSPLL